MDEVIPQLAKQYTVIAPDMLGYGLSGRAAKEELTLPMQAQYIISLLDMIGIQKVNVVGHDLGGGVAQILAVQYPDRVDSFVVIDGVVFSNWPLPKVVSLGYPTAPEFEPSPYFIERMIREGIFHQQMVTHEILQAFIAPFDHENGPRELQEASLALEHHQTEDVVPGLQGVRVPATFCMGNMIGTFRHTGDSSCRRRSRIPRLKCFRNAAIIPCWTILYWCLKRLWPI
ncbi:alpha/beta hydrolase [Bacillus vallismortis]|nr:alpha/beta hydrolase [Bacillus vallismortis]